MWIIATTLIVGLALVAWPTGISAQDHRGGFIRGDPLTLDGMRKEPRIALVIGNSQYESSPLRNPVNDAIAMGTRLEELGFTVMVHTNLSGKGMKRAIRDFGQELKKSGGVGLFYYAGHGIQMDGRNYLIPLDAVINGEADVDIEGVKVGAVLAKMDNARNRLNIVILDACRDNPFARSFRSSTRGLAQEVAPSGTLVAYATAPGKVAADGEGDNGAYTEALLRHMGTPGLSIEAMFKAVRADMQESTADSQTPWENSSIVGDFYFRVPDEAPATVSAEVECPDGTILENGMCAPKIVIGNNLQFGSQATVSTVDLHEEGGTKSTAVGWTLVTLGAVSLGTGGLFAWQISENNEMIAQNARDTFEDGLTERAAVNAQRYEDQGASLETAQWVALGLGASITAAGVIVLMIAQAPPTQPGVQTSRTFELTPIAGPTTGGFQLNLAW
jgi:hypothetical protein